MRHPPVQNVHPAKIASALCQQQPPRVLGVGLRAGRRFSFGVERLEARSSLQVPNPKPVRITSSSLSTSPPPALPTRQDRPLTHVHSKTANFRDTNLIKQYVRRPIVVCSRRELLADRISQGSLQRLVLPVSRRTRPTRSRRKDERRAAGRERWNGRRHIGAREGTGRERPGLAREGPSVWARRPKDSGEDENGSGEGHGVVLCVALEPCVCS